MKKSLLIVILVFALCACIFVGCAQPCTDHVDANNDGICDKCGAEVTKPTPEPSEAVDITSGNASIYEGETLTLSVTKTPEDAVITWTSSDETVATVVDGVVTAVKAGTATVTATIKDGVSDSIVVTVLGYSVSIDNKEVTELVVGDSLTLTATKAPAKAVVAWASSDETVATVVDGVVTAVKAGTVTITASVKEGVEDTIELTVKESISIDNKEDNQIYAGQTLNLTATTKPGDATIVWTSSDETVATVEAGVVIGRKAGKVTITATLNEVSDSVEITILPTVADSTVNSDKFDFSDMFSETPVIRSNGEVNSFVVLSGETGRHYVVSVMVKVTDPSAGDTWSRVGISHYNGSNSYYGFQLSPGSGFNARKTVSMVITDGNVQWGIVTDRSQVWSQHNLASIDFNAVKLTVVRNGNDFYAYLNDQLYYVDNGMENFDNIDTIPVLNVGSCVAEFSQISVQYGQEGVDAYLATADDAKFYGSYGDTVIGEDGSITFTGAAEGTCSQNAKDHGAKYIGTSTVMDANVQGTVEFDLTINFFGSTDPMPALAVTINRYDSDNAQARSLVIAQYKAGWTGWNSNGDLNIGIGSGGEEYKLNGEVTRLEEGETYHVVMTRLMNNGQDLKMLITDKDGNVLIEHAHGWNDGYAGRVVVSFLSRDLDCTISNISITSQVA